MVLSGFSTPKLLTSVSTYAFQPTIPSVGITYAPSSLHRSIYQYRNINRLSIECTFRLPLRSRLTLIRLTLIRNPWSCGGRVSRPPYRYLCLHLLFHTLQRCLRIAFNAEWNAPLPIRRSHSFGSILDARLLSTHNRSTSELLRTL